MSYKPSPRPNFDDAASIPYQEVTRHFWGESTAGRVSDWIYVSSEKIHQLRFGLPPRGYFQHSDEFRTVFAADEVLTVLSGRLVIINPETGEVHHVQPGEAVFFRRDTWHHAFNYSDEPLRVLELFAPPPSQGTSGSYAKTKANLTELRYGQDELVENWPMSVETARKRHTMRVVRESDFAWRFEGNQDRILVGIMASTEHLTAGIAELLPGGRSSVRSHAGDASFYVLDGTLNVHVPEKEGQQWFELAPKDGFYVPEGVKYELHNIAGENTRVLFGVAPHYFDRT